MQLEAAEVRTAQERLRDELGDQAEVGAGDRDRGAAVEAAAEHGQAGERAALLVGEQTPRLVDGRSQAPVPFRHVAHRRGEEVDVALDLVRDLGAGEDGHPRGRELDAERHAVDEPADAEHLRIPGVVEGEARYDLRGPLHEQAHRRGAPAPVLRETQALDVEHPLALHVQPLPRRCQELDVWGALNHLAQKPGPLDEMLEVVEHQQRRALAEVVQQLLLRREAAVRAVDRELNRLGKGGREEVRRSDRGERDEVNAVRVAVDPAGGGREGEPGLTRPARPHKREQAAGGVLQQPVDRFQLRRPADERRSRQRKVLHPRLDRLQQRELARQTLDLELVDALGRAQVLEPVCAEVACLVVDERVSRLRKQYLAAVADGCDARASVDVDSDVSLVGYTRLAGVEPHPDADRTIGQAALGVHGRGGRVRRPRERHEECVTLRIDLDTVVVRTGRADDPAVILECIAVPVAELVQQPRRPLDVREEERHHSTREHARHPTIISPRFTSVERRLCAASPR